MQQQIATIGECTCHLNTTRSYLIEKQHYPQQQYNLYYDTQHYISKKQLWFINHLMILLLLLLICNQQVGCYKTTRQTVASFGQSAYIFYDVSKDRVSTKYDRITLQFRTNEPFGMLLYGCGKQGDYISLALKRGKLVYSANLGSTSDTSGVHGLVIGGHIADDHWHQITITRKTKFIQIVLDNTTNTVSSPGMFRRLDLDDVIFVGGVDERQHCGLQRTDVMDYKFNGCLGDVRFNSIDIIYGAKYGLSSYSSYGDLAYFCSPISDQVVSFTTKRSFIALHQQQNYLNITFDVRTFEPNGLVISIISNKNRLEVLLIGGKLIVQMEGKGVLLNSMKYITDGDWYHIRLLITSEPEEVSLSVNNFKQTRRFPESFGKMVYPLYIGHSRFDERGYIGCLRNLYHDKTRVNIWRLPTRQFQNIKKDCNPIDLCFPSPCKNNGRCSQHNGAYLCDCSGTEFIGDKCERSVYKRTCDEIHHAGQTRNGIYKISPNNRDIYEVYCRMNDTRGAATIILSNSSNKTKVGIDGSLSRLFYFHQVQYSLELNIVTLIADISLSCRQYIKYDCYNSKLLDSLRRYKYEHLNGGRWISRDGTIQTYWGGADPRSKMCGCGMSRSCHLYNLDCNCDSGAKEWLQDAGYLTVKDSLPVTRLQFNMKQTDPSSLFTVGNLECYGTVPIPSTVKPPKTTPTTRDPASENGFASSTLSTNVTTEKENITDVGVSHHFIKVKQDPLFATPYLITIVVVGTILCILLFVLLFVTFKEKLLILFCAHNKARKPCIHVEEYDRYSSAASSDWEFQLANADEYTTASEEDIRIRENGDVRTRRHFLRRLGGWQSRTASAPTIPRRSRRPRRRPSGYKSDTYHKTRAAHGSNHNMSSTSYVYETSSSSSKLSLQSSARSTPYDYPQSSDTDLSQISSLTDDSSFVNHEKKLVDRGVGNDSVIDRLNDSKTGLDKADGNTSDDYLSNCSICQRYHPNLTCPESITNRPAIKKQYQTPQMSNYNALPTGPGNRYPYAINRSYTGRRSIPLNTYTVYAHPTIQEIEGDEDEYYENDNLRNDKESSTLICDKSSDSSLCAVYENNKSDNSITSDNSNYTLSNSEKLLLIKKRVMEQATTNKRLDVNNR